MISTFWILASENKQASKAFPIWSTEEKFHRRSADFDPVPSPQESATENKTGLTSMPSCKAPKWVENVGCFCFFKTFLHVRGKEVLILISRHSSFYHTCGGENTVIYNCVLKMQLTYSRSGRWRIFFVLFCFFLSAQRQNSFLSMPLSMYWVTEKYGQTGACTFTVLYLLFSCPKFRSCYWTVRTTN